MKIKLLHIILLVATSILAIVRLCCSNDDIILHWNFVGTVTSYGPKYFILALPFVSFLLYAFLIQYVREPFKMVRTKKIMRTESNRKLLVSYLKLLIAVVLIVILYVTACSSQFLELQPLLLVIAVLICIAYYLIVRLRLERR